jgi:hypothetical protein
MSAVVSGGTMSKMSEIAQYVAFNGMLSSPKTTAANIVSNAYTTANSVATNATAWAIGSLRGTPDGVTLAQQSAYVRSMMGSTRGSFSRRASLTRQSLPDPQLRLSS